MGLRKQFPSFMDLNQEQEKPKTLEEQLQEAATVPSIEQLQQSQPQVDETEEPALELPDESLEAQSLQESMPVKLGAIPEDVQPSKIQPAQPKPVELATMQDLENAQRARSTGALLGNLADLGQQAGANIAGMAGGEYKPMEMGKGIRELAGMPMQELDEKYKFAKTKSDVDTELEKNDPKSGISVLYRQLAKKKLGDQANIPDNVSAAMLEKILGTGLLKTMGAKGYRYERIRDPDGTVKTYAIDPVTLEKTEIGESGYSVQYRTDEEGRIIPVFGSKPGAGDPVTGVSKFTKPIQGEQTLEQSKMPSIKDLSPNERKVLRDQRDAVLKDKEVEKGRGALSSVSTMQDMLKLGKDTGDDLVRAIQNMGARSTGEVGVMTEPDVAPFGGRAGLLNRIQNIVSVATQGKIPEEDRKFLMNFSKVMERAAKRKIEESSRPYIKSIVDELSPYGITEDNARQMLFVGDISKTNESMKKKIPTDDEINKMSDEQVKAYLSGK